MKHLGDFDTSTVVYGKFTTFRPSTGAAFTLGGTPALSVYKDNSATQTTTGVTLTADFDGVTGLNHFAIDTSADTNFYSSGSFFDIVITTGTVDSVSVVGAVVGSFTLRKTSALKPTTAGRTLDVSAGGEAGLDWANVGTQGSTVALTATTIATTQKVDVETIKTQAVTAAAGVTFPTSIASPTNITGGTITTVTNLTNAPTSGDLTATMKTSINTEVAAASGGGPLLRANTATAATSSTITLDGSASAVNDYYNGCFVTAEGQTRQIIDYVGSTKVATIYVAGPPVQGAQWVTTPSGGGLAYKVHGYAIQPVPVTASGGVVSASLSASERNSIATALLDLSDSIETGVTVRGATRLQLAALAGKVSGAGTGTEVFRNAVQDSKDRITATVDTSGNRTAITTDQT